MRKISSKSKQSGFTIVEVMIVIAIAGLIMLIVFLAVPALQRNSRNTQRKNDASKLMSAVIEYANNHRNQYPASCNGSNADCFVRGVKTSHYDVATNSVTFFRFNGPILGDSNFAGSNSDGIIIANYAKCNDNNEATGTNASAKSLVALFAVETSGGTDTQCIEG
jgi:prepilin-type N-terminal cleavage/methylation domain-containing protein